jgi:hypothetical protein
MVFNEPTRREASKMTDDELARNIRLTAWMAQKAWDRANNIGGLAPGSTTHSTYSGLARRQANLNRDLVAEARNRMMYGHDDTTRDVLAEHGITL